MTDNTTTDKPNNFNQALDTEGLQKLLNNTACRVLYACTKDNYPFDPVLLKHDYELLDYHDQFSHTQTLLVSIQASGTIEQKTTVAATMYTSLNKLENFNALDVTVRIKGNEITLSVDVQHTYDKRVI